MKRTFRIIKITIPLLDSDNETIHEMIEYRIQQYCLGWTEYGHNVEGWRSFDSEKNAMAYLLRCLKSWWKDEIEHDEREKAKRKLKKQLRTTTVVVGKYTFTEKDLNELMQT